MIAAFIAWGGYSMYAPHVSRVERDGDGRLIISGRNFGSSRGDSALIYSAGETEIEIDVNEWSNDRIIARLRGEVVSGSVSVKRAFWLLYWPSSAAALVIPEAGLPSKPFGYDVPVQAGSPWPLARRNPRNSGESPLPAVYGGDQPWSFTTGAGVLSTPVIDADGVVYFGSADHNFYAVGADGTERWRYRSGGVIDAGAALLRADSESGATTVVVGSGDGYLYRLKTAAGLDSNADREHWVFDARVSSPSRYDNGFEAGVGVGHDGTLYAGNTAASYYAVNRNGELRWSFATEGGNRSIGAFGADGAIFSTSVDGYVRSLDPNGSEKWATGTWGAIVASAAVGSDGTVYIGSFDSYFYALDAASGSVRWTFKTGDHIVSSAALGHDASGRTDAIYFGSTDGHLYALDPKGELLWKYDTGDPVRSSPGVGRGPDGDGPGIVYCGSGNGKLYALNAVDGQRRWSFDTTPSDEELHDRNDLNGSVALGHNGIYVGSESGSLWYVPYDYCLQREDARCSTTAGEDLPKDLAAMVYVSPGGRTYLDNPPPVSPATVINLRLIVRKRGRTIDARLCNVPLLCSPDDVSVETDPPFEFRLQQSADGRYLQIIPEEILAAGGTYRIRVAGEYHTGGFHLGNVTIGGSGDGQFKGGMTIRTREVSSSVSLAPKRDEVPAFEWTRLSVPVPAMLTSFDQIAFDDMEWIFSVVDARPSADGRGRLIVWGIGGQRDAKGMLVADPDPRATLALSGTYAGDSIALTGGGSTVHVAGVAVPLEHFTLRGQFDADMKALPGATMFAEADALSVPGYGSTVVGLGLASGIYDKLVVTGTYLTRPYPRTAPANKRPRGLQVSFVEYAQTTDRLPGQVVAHFRLTRGAHYKLAEHRVGILLIDRTTGEVVPLNYHEQLYASANPQGEVSQVVLTIPAGKEVSHDLGIIVLADGFPLHRERLEYRPQAK